ncbi:MAG: DKNYY domain-containing protein [Peptostreptococcaceae bacterium]|nr:DKNYY domain-containing protein [Peptostreptococcaceae bacterium]
MSTPIALTNRSAEECEQNGCSFWTDGVKVYYGRNNVPLKNIDPKKTLCWKNFAFDDERFFIENQLLRNVSPVGFVVLNHAFSRTQSHIITQSGTIKIDPSDMVQVLDEGSWYENSGDFYPKGYLRINDNIWYEVHWSDGLVKLKKVHPEHFRSLGDGVLGLDNERVYAFGKIVRGAKAQDFRKVLDSRSCGYFLSNKWLYFENEQIVPAKEEDLRFSEHEIIRELIICKGRYYRRDREITKEQYEKWLHKER